MRNLKRFLAMTLTMLMVVGSFSFASFAKSFDDVYDYANAIDVLSDLGVIWGYEDGTFGPDDTVQRWHMALWIAKMETGKVSSDDYVTVWKADANFTNFTDVTVDQAVGAINYASDEGIIIGRSATIFDPTAGITYQDALTMVVRALGFGGSAMDAGYPWKYINKASQLGLEKGISGVAYTDVLTRAETAQILANALYVKDSSGKTYISDVFGLATVVITGDNNYMINNAASVAKTGFVSFNLLNSDGTINNNVTYHLPASAFGIEAADVDKYIGASFRVTTADNFQSLGVVIANPSKTFDAADIVGQGTPAAPSGETVKLGADTYKAVKGYTSLYNAQGNTVNTSEILVYVTNAVEPASSGYFTADANGNLLDKTGKIVAYYAPAITGSYAEPYVVKTNNAYTLVAVSELKGGALGAIWNATYTNAYALTTNTYDLVKNNKHATAVAYDDNNDGVYDRLFYTYQSIANIYANADTPAVANDYYLDQKSGRTSLVVSKFIDNATGEALAAAPTGYIRYSYDPLSKYLTVYQNYTYGTGLVTAVNTSAATVVIGGTQYSVGIATYPGAVFSAVAANDQTGLSTALVGKQVNFILDSGIVVKIFDAASASTYIVFDNITGLTSQGYATALVYAQSAQASVITIATINGYSYQTYLLMASQNSLSSIFDTLDSGDLFLGTKDALGFWHLTSVSEYTYLAGWNRNPDHRYPSFKSSIFFKNGIANTSDNWYYDGKLIGSAKAFTQFNTSASTLYIVYNSDTDKFTTRVGIPLDGAEINVYDGMFVVMSSDTTYGPTASFVYVNDGTLSGYYTTGAWTNTGYDTVIYVPANAAAYLVTNDLGTTGMQLGYIWTYGNVLDMTTGKYTTVKTTNNTQLTLNSFYTVSNGYIEDIITPYTDGALVKEGLLKAYGTYYSSIDAFMGPDSNSYSSYTIIYSLDANGNLVVDANGNFVKYTADISKTAYVPVYYYAADDASSRVILTLPAPTVYGSATAPLQPTVNGDFNVFGNIPTDLYTALTAANHFFGTNNSHTQSAWLKIYYNDATLVTSGSDPQGLIDVDTGLVKDYILQNPLFTLGGTYYMSLKYMPNRGTLPNYDTTTPSSNYYVMYFRYNQQTYKVYVDVSFTAPQQP